ncbi:MAG: SGNH/GDSL hydrolase family protein [Planctomycetota bacterium]
MPRVAQIYGGFVLGLGRRLQAVLRAPGRVRARRLLTASSLLLAASALTGHSFAVQAQTAAPPTAAAQSTAAQTTAPPTTASPTSPLELRDGDRVVLLGGTMVERLQVYGHLETLLTAAHYDRAIGFRNLGWSGDTVQGDARAVFGGPADGFKRLVKDTLDAKPTIIVLNYGANEAYAGPAGIAPFIAGLGRLVDALQPANAKIVIWSPAEREKLPAPLPDPTTYNQQLRQYCDALQQFAAERKLAYYDLLDTITRPFSLSAPGATEARTQLLTENGLHLSELGQAVVAQRLAERLGVALPEWNVAIDLGKETNRTAGVAVENLKKTERGVTFRATARQLPLPPVYENRQPGPQGLKGATARVLTLPQQDAVLQIAGLPRGTYELRIDDQLVKTAEHDAWAKGVRFELAADRDQAEQLRREIYDKNVLYFHRYRPQNETYLFLFRKHEQGNNAVEIPQFDPLVAAREQKIAELRRPVARGFELRAKR